MIFPRRQITFQDFLEKIIEELDVPASRHASADNSYQSVARWLSRPESSLRTLSPQVYVQGSFSLGTAIRPLTGDDEYDIDAVCEVLWDKNSHSQQMLKKSIGNELIAYANSKKMEQPEPGRRCWTLVYSDDAQFHMDVLPAVPDSERQRTLLEMSGYDMRDVRQFLDTAISITDEQHPYYSFPYLDWLGSNPRGYQKWFIGRMQDVFDERRQAIALNERKDVSKVPNYRVKTPLQRSIQLLKRHRDVMFADDDNQLKPISIIITTLAAKAYNQERELVPAFTNIVGNMDRFIDDNFGEPQIFNPVDPRENFADKWREHPERREAFREWLASVRNDIDEASRITVAEDAITHLSPILGHKPVESAGRKLFPSAVKSRALDAATKSTVLLAEHKKKPDWPKREKFKVEITSATTDRRGFRRQEFASNGAPLPKHAKLWFRAKTNAPKPFDVYWQVVNTGPDAIRAGGLRGGFDKGLIEKGRLKRKESTLYAGTHSIECFIVKDGYFVARSGPFIVNIA